MFKFSLVVFFFSFSSSFDFKIDAQFQFCQILRRELLRKHQRTKIDLPLRLRDLIIIKIQNDNRKKRIRYFGNMLLEKRKKIQYILFRLFTEFHIETLTLQQQYIT